MLHSAEHEILNVHKYKKYHKIKFFQSQLSLNLFFLLINVEMPTLVSRKNFMQEFFFITLGPGFFGTT